MSGENLTAVVFDLGGVLIDWDPRYVYRDLFDGDEDAAERFLGTVTTQAWNHEQDRGRTFDEGVEILTARYPQHRELIAAYRDRWPDMLGGAIDGTVDILEELRKRDLGLYALTNWSAETFPVAEERFPFLDWFDGVVVSGRERLAKPEPEIFTLLTDRFDLEPPSTLFIDDSPANVEAARAAGLLATRFTSPEALRDELVAAGALEGR